MASRKQYIVATAHAARKYGLDPHVFVQQIKAESNFDPNAGSPAGARGIAQFMPATARGLGVNPDDPQQALDGAAKLMASYVKKYGNYKDALTAYNAGPGRVGGPLPAETQAYIAKILGGSDPGGLGKAQSSRRVTVTPGQTTTSTDKNGALVAALLDGKGSRGLLSRWQGLLDSGQFTNTTTSSSKVKVSPASGASSPTGSASSVKGVLGLTGTVKFDGKPVAAWVGHILSYARAHGWKGTLSSGYRDDATQTRIYKSGVRPAALPKSMGGKGSNHEGTRYPLGAADVTEAEQLAKVLRGSPYASVLQYAGSKDPVHFSHPHGGSY